MQLYVRCGGQAGVGLGGSEDTGLHAELSAEASGEMGLSGPRGMSLALGGQQSSAVPGRGWPAGAPRGRVPRGRLPSPLAGAQAGRTGRARFTFQNIHEVPTSDGICEGPDSSLQPRRPFFLSRSARFVHTRALSRPTPGFQRPPPIVLTSALPSACACTCARPVSPSSGGGGGWNSLPGRSVPCFAFGP